MDEVFAERGFHATLHETSAKTGAGLRRARESDHEAIDWKKSRRPLLPPLPSNEARNPALADSGLVLIRLAELKRRLELRLPVIDSRLAQLETVVGLLAGPA